LSKTQKAYKNLDFLNSPMGRTVRILCEYEEPRQRLREQHVRDTIVVYGSARTKPGTRFYEDARELSRRLTEWSLDYEAGKYIICTGGGPGIMEACNRGASEVPGGRSLGLGISLPFEEKVNQYVPDELAFEFHYFFMRKLWFMYLAKAVVIMPGGFGTLDELFESLTLRQTDKIKKPLPTVMYGEKYWRSVLNLDAMVEEGTISSKDLDLLYWSDSVDDTYEYITSQLVEHYGRP
jgi:uncharacterized protein (TIGR00730 family)